MVVTGRASDLNSLLSSKKSNPVNQEANSRTRTGINNVENKLILVIIAVYIGYVEITP